MSLAFVKHGRKFSPKARWRVRLVNRLGTYGVRLWAACDDPETTAHVVKSYEHPAIPRDSVQMFLEISHVGGPVSDFVHPVLQY